MAQIDIEILTPFAARFMEGTTLTPAERAEVLRIAQGFACKDSAAAAGVSPETIRARRKRIYRKLDVPGSGERLVVVMPHTKAEGGLRVARRLAAVVRERKWTPRLTVSVGVATHGGDGTVSFGGLVKRAGEALERARAAGGDRAEAADPVKKRDRIWMG